MRRDNKCWALFKHHGSEKELGDIREATNKAMGAWHCEMCEKWAGGTLMTAECGSDVTFEGKQNVSVFNSSKWSEQAFCTKCDSHLYCRLKELHQFIMPTGLFDTELYFLSKFRAHS